MKKFLPIFLFLAAFSCGCVTAGTPNFTADVVTISNGKAVKSRVFFAGNKIRTESRGYVNILRVDRGLEWTLRSDKKLYSETTIDRSIDLIGEKLPGEYSRQKIGVENVNGEKCTKYKVLSRVHGEDYKTYQWLSEDKIPVKVSSIDESEVIEYLNIRRDGIKPSLFEIPRGYVKVSMGI